MHGQQNMKLWNYCEKSGLIKQSVKYSILVWFTLCAKNEKLGAITFLVSLMFSTYICSLFHNYNVFGSCFIHILYTECAKI